MASDQIGNTVGTTPAYAAEKAKLAAVSTPDTVTSLDSETTLDIKGSPVLDVSSYDIQTAGLEPSPELIQAFKEMVAEQESKLNTGDLRADPVDLVEFQDFKRQVIAAFKHLGLDTRKHFTE